MDDLAKDFTDGSKIPQLVPKIDYSGGISSHPLLGLQIAANFGWGRPIFMRPANIVHEGKAYILPSSNKDGSLTLVTRLEISHMKLFGKLLYEL
ncbi:Uncharacterized protein TCM_022141 [Theobroma cacao]|uniref:HXXXD-type acyl-transferase family protein n=1 Tax=Theobroma cacao TaxID=3641 RepID=A0A061ES12_THECC|nr:Uncharacterized protein TCM_022141 [Theobroma cacao]